MASKPVTGAQVRTMLEEIVGKVTKVWDERLARVFELHQGDRTDIRALQARVHRLERIIERMGKAALQEKP